ncbi:hypothetical protein HQ393_10595 [Chitinibacter bivalviorum]|uniref:HEAT repeat domain-containing protein n=1 Tax=Chitinibacter bivalviorum TaxID=2739434 RepID=A0A7H9BJW1_9NEIS|nr:hypothetical protein [Chitinibacter bivalviorum]QLG88652.1 hypothetical protein HQ393_10595 [Chitinibacter bivalviorum]
MRPVNVDEWLNEILSRDAMTFEEAYWRERPPANEAVPRILQALTAPLDSYTRGKLIELLGECEDLSVLHVLEKELLSPDESMQFWASLSIDALNSLAPWQKSSK